MPDVGTVVAFYGAILATVVAALQIRALLRERPSLSLQASFQARGVGNDLDRGIVEGRVRLAAVNTGRHAVYVTHLSLLSGKTAVWSTGVTWRLEPSSPACEEFIPAHEIRRSIASQGVSVRINRFVATDSIGHRWKLSLAKDWSRFLEPSMPMTDLDGTGGHASQ